MKEVAYKGVLFRLEVDDWFVRTGSHIFVRASAKFIGEEREPSELGFFTMSRKEVNDESN